jgi:hypothetical protein
MRHILCEGCAGKHSGEGRRMLLAATAFEPAEYERIMVGIARTPTPDQRVMTIGTEAMKLAPGYFNCDDCNERIMPGEPATARTVWVADREPAPWEHEFLDFPNVKVDLPS